MSRGTSGARRVTKGRKREMKRATERRSLEIYCRRQIFPLPDFHPACYLAPSSSDVFP